jgi:hypothetical protein
MTRFSPQSDVIGWNAVPTALTVVETANVLIRSLVVSNSTASPITFTIVDGQAGSTPLTFSVPNGVPVLINGGQGWPMLGGFSIQAGSAGLTFSAVEKFTGGIADAANR